MYRSPQRPWLPDGHPETPPESSIEWHIVSEPPINPFDEREREWLCAFSERCARRFGFRLEDAQDVAQWFFHKYLESQREDELHDPPAATAAEPERRPVKDWGRGYCATMIHRRFLDLLRERGEHPAASLDDPADRGGGEGGESPETRGARLEDFRALQFLDALIARNQVAQLPVALTALGEDERAAWCARLLGAVHREGGIELVQWLSGSCGMALGPYIGTRALAQHLRIPKGTVDSQASRARARIVAWFKAHR